MIAAAVPVRQENYKGLMAVMALMTLVLFTGVNALVYILFAAFAAFICLAPIAQSFALYVMIAPLDRLLVLPNGIHIVAYLMIVLFLKALYELIMVKAVLNRTEMTIFVLLLIFLGYEFAHFIFLEIPSLTRNILFYACIASVVLFTLLRPQINMPLTAGGMAFSAIYGSFLSMREVGSLNMLAQASGMSARFAIGSEDVNTYGVYLLVIASANIGCFVLQKKARGLFLLNTVLLVFFGFLTLSRGFILNLALLIAVGVFFLFEWSLEGVGKMVGGVMLAILVGLVLLRVPVVKAIVDNYVGRFQVSDLSNGRFGIFEEYFLYMREHVEVFLFGLGMDNYRGVTGINKAVHNTFIEVILSEGVVGLGLIGAMMVVVINRIPFALFSKAVLFLLPLAALFIGSLTLSLFAITSFYYYLLFAVMALHYHGTLVEKKHQEKVDSR